MREEDVGIGSGGQGIQLMFKIRALVLHNKGYSVAYKEDYGPEMEGGRSAGYLVIKESPDDWPGIKEPDILIALSRSGFDFWISKVKKNGLIFYDPALVSFVKEPGDERKYYAVPASEISAEVKDRRTVNMAMLGGVSRITELTSIEEIVEALKKERKYSEANQKALEEGYKRIHLLDE